MRTWSPGVPKLARIEQVLFSLELPAEWEWVADERGGGAVPPCAPGVLHISAEAVENPAELPNLSRMLAGFLTLHVRPVATDELIPWEFPEATGFCWQYIEEAAGQPPHAWRVWVAGNEQAWAFVSFNCELDHLEVHRQAVDRVVASLRLIGPGADEPPTGPAG